MKIIKKIKCIYGLFYKYFEKINVTNYLKILSF